MQSSTHRYSTPVPASRAWVVARLICEDKTPKCSLILCKDSAAAETFLGDLKTIAGHLAIFSYQGWDSLAFEHVSPSLDVTAERLGIIDRLRKNAPIALVTTPAAILQRIMPPSFFQEFCLELRVGLKITIQSLSDHLSKAGYKRATLVESVGEFVAHGSVVDIFPAWREHPIRLELKNDNIISIRNFDSETQRSLDSIPLVQLAPAQERYFRKGVQLNEAVELIKARGKELQTPAREIVRFVSALREGEALPGIELLEPIINENLPTLLDYLPLDSRIIFNDALAVDVSIDRTWEQLSERSARFSDQHYLVPKLSAHYILPELLRNQWNTFEQHYLDHLDLSLEDQDTPEFAKVRATTTTMLQTKLKSRVGSGKALDPLRTSIARARRNEFKVACVVETDVRQEKLVKLLLEIDVDAQPFDGSAIEWLGVARPYPVVVLRGSLSSGFELPDEHLLFISEQDIFHERSHRTARKSKVTLKKLLSSLAQLQANDYVVHADFGVGIYRGLKHLDVDNVASDFLHIDYADTTLYLPIHNIAKVQKFSAAEGQTPKLDRLRNSRWTQTKHKVKESIATLAGDLLKLYATRSVAKGWRFEPLGSEDERFAEEFPYDETPDQLKAIKETISDMALDRPMDRLICGDVGFGKTEVALRAAFKCVQHSRQVAVLVPTTILAEQHRLTFTKRFEGEPVKIGAVSRVFKPEQNAETVAKLAKGEIDIIIGTHRLLSKDVQFADLGLVVVDEEHRFGVKHKERLKELKKQVDVLTLTATPIPRTLHMSLLGIRDISVIMTPPTDRRLIRTYVARYDETLVRDVINRELERGGQVFYLHNRVQSIDSMAATLRDLVPHARIAFAHGQMNEITLEKIMRQFLEKELDVLISTTIIESGIDIPNANTIIIERADMFGLAQLYQLRGRVGRSQRQAFAYLLVPSGNLTQDARERLKALQALDDLGVGFNLAMRDLEIRGAGNLLGKEQSGTVAAVGFDLYTKILREAIANLKGEEYDFRESIEPEIKLPVAAYIPEAYVPDVSERLVLYQRFSSIQNAEEAKELLDELADRYGALNTETLNLANIMRLRASLRHWGIVKLEAGQAKLIISLHPKATIDPNKLLSLVKRKTEILKLSNHLSLIVSDPSLSLRDCEEIETYLAQLYSEIMPNR